MSEANKKQINLSWLKMLGQKKQDPEKKEDLEVLDVPEIVEKKDPLLTSPQGRGTEQKWDNSFSPGGKDAWKADRGQEIEEEKIKIKSSKISLAGMKQKRDTPKTSVSINEKTLVDVKSDEKLQAESKDNDTENKTLSLDNEKVEIVLNTEEESWKKNNNEASDNKWEDSSKTSEDTKESTSLFSNYTSDFEKEERSILEKIKELWKKPKTRIILVVVLIVSTILWIAALFTIDPKRNSISRYKSVLIGAYNKYTGNNTYEKKNQQLLVKETVKQQWEKDSLIRTGYKITIETKINDSGGKIYKFNNTEFDTISKLNTAIDIEIKKLKSSKVKDFLLKAKLKKQKNDLKTKTNMSNTPTDSPKKSNLDLLRSR